MSVYDATPAADVRRAVLAGGFEIRGDGDRTVDAMILAADADAPPRRLALGSAAFENIEAALVTRLAELRDQRDVAYAAERSRPAGSSRPSSHACASVGGAPQRRRRRPDAASRR